MARENLEHERLNEVERLVHQAEALEAHIEGMPGETDASLVTAMLATATNSRVKALCLHAGGSLAPGFPETETEARDRGRRRRNLS